MRSFRPRSTLSVAAAVAGREQRALWHTSPAPQMLPVQHD